MRQRYSVQTRLDCETVSEVNLNINCRDELIPILRALQHVYCRPSVRDAIVEHICDDVNRESRRDRGREGLSYWQILVLAAVRLGCNLDYDKLQDLAEQHRALRQIMGIGDWEEEINFSWRRIRDNICLLKPETVKQISDLIVKAGHEFAPEAIRKMRLDSFVVETNIHYPTESSLIVDGLRKTIELCTALAGALHFAGWRQHAHLLKRIKRVARGISRISARKNPKQRRQNKKLYRVLLKRAEKVLGRARELCCTLENQANGSMESICQLASLKRYIELTEQVCNTARRRVLEGQQVSNDEKLFSIFEPHTQLYKRGKAAKPVQFGRLVLVGEDAAGFIAVHEVMPRDAQDQDMVVPTMRTLQERFQGRIEEASFDRGFHSPQNQQQLAELIARPCLPKPGSIQSAEQAASATVQFHNARQRHPGIESAIGALQSGNGMDRCRDATENGFERYVALGILGRNLHVLGKLLIAREEVQANAAFSKRGAA